MPFSFLPGLLDATVLFVDLVNFHLETTAVVGLIFALYILGVVRELKMCDLCSSRSGCLSISVLMLCIALHPRSWALAFNEAVLSHTSACHKQLPCSISHLASSSFSHLSLMVCSILLPCCIDRTLDGTRLGERGLLDLRSQSVLNGNQSRNPRQKLKQKPWRNDV